MYDLDHLKCELEFYADVEDVKEQKEDEMFTIDDLKRGMKCIMRNGSTLIVDKVIDDCIHYIDQSSDGCIRCSNAEYYLTLHGVKGESGADIIEVYDLNVSMGDLNSKPYKLIWKREEVKEMTIEDIQKVLGHKIKVVE